MKKIAVIGANSYIARNLIYLLREEYQCELMLYGREDAHFDGIVPYRKIDVFDKEMLSQIDLNVDIVFVFIGKTGSVNGFDEYDSFIDINEKALLNILDALRKQNSKGRVIFPSTRLVYKGQFGSLKEDAEKEFKTIYAINKYACEKILWQYNNVFSIPYTIFRICVPYGTLVHEASSYGTAEIMLSKARNKDAICLYGDGGQRRTVTHIGDVCRQMIEGGLSPKCVNDVYNIGGENYSLHEMADKIAEKYGTRIEKREWPEIALKIESGDTVFDGSKLERVINYKYRQSFEDWIASIDIE